MAINGQLVLGILTGAQTLGLAIWAYLQRKKKEEKEAMLKQISDLKGERVNCAATCLGEVHELRKQGNDHERRLSTQEGTLQQVTKDLDNIRNSMTQMGTQMNFIVTNTLTKADIPLLAAALAKR